MYWYGELTFSYSFFSVWTHKSRFLAKLLHIPKRAKNAIFYRKCRVFPVFSFFSFFFVFSVCFETVCFGCFASIPKQSVSMFRLNRNKQKINRNSLIGSIVCNFLQKFMVFSVFFSVFWFFRFFSRFFRFVSKQFVSVFRLFRFYTETESVRLI